MAKSLDTKLKKITSGKYTPKDFIVADAKDPEMSGGASSTGPRDLADESKGFHSVEHFRQTVVDMVKKGNIDIMLVAASSLEMIAKTGIFKKSNVTPAIRAYVVAKLDRVTRHFDHVIDVNVVLSVDKLDQKAEVNVHLSGKDIHVQCHDADMYAAIDGLVDKLDRQIIKHKEKHQESRSGPSAKRLAD